MKISSRDQSKMFMILNQSLVFELLLFKVITFLFPFDCHDVRRCTKLFSYTGPMMPPNSHKQFSVSFFFFRIRCHSQNDIIQYTVPGSGWWYRQGCMAVVGLDIVLKSVVQFPLIIRICKCSCLRVPFSSCWRQSV